MDDEPLIGPISESALELELEADRKGRGRGVWTWVVGSASGWLGVRSVFRGLAEQLVEASAAASRSGSAYGVRADFHYHYHYPLSRFHPGGIHDDRESTWT